MAEKRTIIALDVDGTLKEYGGLISRSTIEHLKPLTHIGICSARADAPDIASRLGLGFGMTGKYECLKEFERQWGKGVVGKLYIGDLPLDEEAAKRAGWNFVNVNHIKLNLGSGGDIRYGYINIDIRPLPGTNLILDLENQKLPFEDGIVEEVVAQDVLEHISWRKLEGLVKEIWRVLKPGGTLYVRVPDTKRIVDKVLNGQARLPGLHGWKLLSFMLGGEQDYPENFHKSFFTKDLLKEFLEGVGFEVYEIWNDNGNVVAYARKK